MAAAATSRFGFAYDVVELCASNLLGPARTSMQQKFG